MSDLIIVSQESEDYADSWFNWDWVSISYSFPQLMSQSFTTDKYWESDITDIMTYRVVLYRAGSIVKHGTQEIKDINVAIDLAKKVAVANKGCYTKIHRVG